MRIAEIEISGENPKITTIEFLQKMYGEGYSIDLPDSYIFFYEQWSARNASTFTINFVIVDQKETNFSKVKLHIVAGGSSTGYLNFDWWKTRDEIKNIHKELVKYGQHNKMEVGELHIITKSLF